MKEKNLWQNEKLKSARKAQNEQLGEVRKFCNNEKPKSFVTVESFSTLIISANKNF